MLEKFLELKLQNLAENSLLRTIQDTKRSLGVNVVRDGKNLISFCDNDYLGLASNEQVIEAAIGAAWGYGAGAMASRLVTGSHPLYSELEALLAQIKGAESCCVFGSGYLTNLAVIPALMGKGDLIIADKLVHSCILDGIKISGAKLKRFAHNNVQSAQKILQKERGNYKNCLIITETVFSMDGDIAPIAQLKKLSEKHNAWLMTDDAHGFGVVDIINEADIQMGTLSKAVGSYGGYVCGSKILINYLKSTAKTLIYSTALPPSVVGASIAALQIIKKESLGQEVIKKARIFTGLLGLPNAESAIVPVIIGGDADALRVSSVLQGNGFLVTAIRQPTVAKNTARLRVTFNVLHKDDDIKKLAEAYGNI